MYLFQKPRFKHLKTFAPLRYFIYCGKNETLEEKPLGRNKKN